MKYEESLKQILEQYKYGKLKESEVLSQLRACETQNLGFADIDQDRSRRQGFPEVVYCAGKTTDQVVKIMEQLYLRHDNFLGTRAAASVYEQVKKVIPEAEYDAMSHLILVERKPLPKDEQRVITVVTAGTSDMPVAEEAALTAAIMGNKVQRIYDVGVAGISRLLNRTEDLRRANVLIIIAGMEGALASVVGGLVAKPVIAVPTSVGYGANFKGLSALLGMLNSCSSIAVVNIDNGFGAGRMASIINHMR